MHFWSLTIIIWLANSHFSFTMWISYNTKKHTDSTQANHGTIKWPRYLYAPDHCPLSFILYFFNILKKLEFYLKSFHFFEYFKQSLVIKKSSSKRMLRNSLWCCGELFGDQEYSAGTIIIMYVCIGVITRVSDDCFKSILC